MDTKGPASPFSSLARHPAKGMHELNLIHFNPPGGLGMIVDISQTWETRLREVTSGSSSSSAELGH